MIYTCLKIVEKIRKSSDFTIQHFLEKKKPFREHHIDDDAGEKDDKPIKPIVDLSPELAYIMENSLIKVN
jgi:hypothetical protein